MESKPPLTPNEVTEHVEIEGLKLDKQTAENLRAIAPNSTFADQLATAMGTPTIAQRDAAEEREAKRRLEPLANFITTRATLPLESLRESLTNPRKRWVKLDELAASIRAIGRIIVPLLVRAILPLEPAAPPVYEIISGARRFRGGKMAGLTDFPVEICQLSDDHVLEIQLVENLQRDDLTPLEEAEGYAQMVKLGYEVPTIALRLGVSTGWVYSRKKLAELGPEAVTALTSGRLEVSVAEVLARQPHSRQGEALRGLARLTGVKEQIEYLQKEFARNLKGSPFDLKDATLPRLCAPDGLGDCVHCPKNSNNEPRELFKDYSTIERAGICSDSPCYRARADEIVKRKLEKVKADGAEVLSLAQVKRVVVAGAPVSGAAYVIASDVISDDPKRRTWGQALAETELAITYAPDEQELGHVLKLYDRKAAVKAAVELGIKGAKRQAPAEKSDAVKAKLKASNEKARIIAATVEHALPQIVEKWGKGLALPELRAAAAVALETVGKEDADVLMFAFKGAGNRNDPSTELAKWIDRTATAKELPVFIVAALLFPRWQSGADELEPELVKCAKSAGVDLAEIGRAQLAAVKAEGVAAVKWKTIEGGVETTIDGELYGVSFNGGGPKLGYFWKGPTGRGAACDSIEAGKLKLLELAGIKPPPVKPKGTKAVRS